LKRAASIRVKLTGDLGDAGIAKPPKMRHATFERLVAELRRCERLASAPTRIQQLVKLGYTHRQARVTAFVERMDRVQDSKRERKSPMPSALSAPVASHVHPAWGADEELVVHKTFLWD
jgi:hypothetical protein